ncbi:MULTISPECIES: helix-turn-helix domain-containing protein [unclassified Enterococcus]|uniref:helix-turn-helix domain-containing protein n=1 Tax=unclassified Enterococcus TaxID=2608891 RepID=UPI0013ECEC57|nr:MULTISPECIES: helix-turn-helix domain-containing protein [unclassified Enterococcus]
MQTQEAIKTHLLKKKNKVKLEIFLFLTEHRLFITIPYLANHFKMSESNFLLYIQELEEDFANLGLKNIHIDKQKHFLKLELEDTDLAFCYYRLFGRYCIESTNYQILTAIFNRQTNSIIALSQQTNYSASYIYSKMKAINEFLSLYGLTVSFSNKGTKDLSGTEIQILYCLLDVYWNIFSSTATLFYQEDRQMIGLTLSTYFKKEVLERLSVGMVDKLYLLLKICRESFPATTSGAVQKEFENYAYIDFFIDPIVDILRPGLPICRDQRIMINVLARLSISEIEDEASSRGQYDLLLEAKVPHILYSKKLVEAFSETFDLSIPENYRIIYSLNFAKNTIYSGFLSTDQPNTPLPTFMLYQEHAGLKEIQVVIEQFYRAFKQHHQDEFAPLAEKENEEWMIEDLVHLYDRYKKERPIVIGVNYTRDFYISKDLLVKIEQIFSKESITIQKDFMETCDIVISDCPLQLPSHIKKIYLLDGIITPQDWQKVIMKIAEYVFELKEKVSK